MDSPKNPPKNIDEYIAGFPPEVQKFMSLLRGVIHEAAPEATERISYQMPAFHQNGVLVWFGGFKDHISFFPTGDGVSAFEGELGHYKHAKGTIQLPLDEPLPADLIKRIVKYRVEAVAQGKKHGKASA